MPPTARVLIEVERERTRQDAKWGPQNHPYVPIRWLSNGPTEIQRMLGIPTTDEARDSCEYEADIYRAPTWAHILVEEVSEAIEQAVLHDTSELRKELIQVAAVAVAWVEAIDRRTKENA